MQIFLLQTSTQVNFDMQISSTEQRQMVLTVLAFRALCPKWRNPTNFTVVKTLLCLSINCTAKEPWFAVTRQELQSNVSYCALYNTITDLDEGGGDGVITLDGLLTEIHVCCLMSRQLLSQFQDKKSSIALSVDACRLWSPWCLQWVGFTRKQL